MSREWFEDHHNIAALITWLGDNTVTTVGWGPDDYANLVEEPWHYTPEWNEMCRWEREMEVAGL